MNSPTSPPNSCANSVQLELFQTETLTDGQSRRSRRATSLAATFATSSPVRGCGPTPLSSPVGHVPALPPGPPACHANRSRKRGSEAASRTNGTYGQYSSGSLSSESLASSLASKLRAITDSRGSTVYSMTWRTRVTPARRQIPQLLAMAPRRNGKGSTGSRRGWATPRRSSANCSEADAKRAFDGKCRLETEVHLVPREVQPDIGVMHFGFSVLTDLPARLDPDFVRWLTGLPRQWSYCGLMATLAMPRPQSALQSRREKRFRNLVSMSRNRTA